MSVFWLLWIMLWLKWCYKYLFELVFLFSLNRYPGIEFLDHAVVLCLIFWEEPILFSIVVIPNTSQTNSVQQFSFSLHPSQQLLFPVFGNNYCNRCEVIVPCGFNFHFPDVSNVEHLFMDVGHLLVIFGKIFIGCHFILLIFLSLRRLLVWWSSICLFVLCCLCF